MRIVFDPATDAANIAKHGISLARAEDLEILAFLVMTGTTTAKLDFAPSASSTAWRIALSTPSARNIFGPSAFAVPMPSKYGAMSPDPIIDDDNPEWADADFARAQTADTPPQEILAAFPRTAGGAKAKVSVAISADVVRSFQAGGADWESRIDEVLRKAIAG